MGANGNGVEIRIVLFAGVIPPPRQEGGLRIVCELYNPAAHGGCGVRRDDSE